MTIETKYNIGDEVWFCTSKPLKGKITGVFFESNIDFVEDEISYYVKREEWFAPIFLREFQLFPTKEELLKSL